MQNTKASDYPPLLYKGVDPENMNDLINQGILGIGTLHGYRDVPNAKPGVQDAEEGRRIVEVDSARIEVGKPIPEAFSQHVHGVPGAPGIVRLEDCDLVQDSPDFYMVSTSLTLAAAKTRALTGIIIRDPCSFGILITEHLAHLGLALRGQFIADECAYEPKRQSWRTYTQTPITMHKPPELTFQIQCEFRYLWFPLTGVTPTYVRKPIPGLRDIIEAW